MKFNWFKYMDEEVGAGGGSGAAASDAAESTADEGNHDAGSVNTDDTAATDGNIAGVDKAKKDEVSWAPNWRAEHSGGDPKIEKMLERYASPIAASKGHKDANTKLSSGQLMQKLGDNPTDEELKDYRSKNGIPETVDGYGKDLGGGVVIGDDDAEGVAIFDKAMHDSNATTDVRNAALKSYLEVENQKAIALEERDVEERSVCEEALRAEWGGEYKRNTNALINTLSAKMDEEDVNAFINARDGTGQALFNNPAIVRGLLAMTLEANPLATVVAANGGDIHGSIDEEIANIEKTMKTDRATYNGDEKMQARYRELLGWKDNQK
jgi:hypothetical protein